jgi:predicted MPP superfamily phosphohydrolase
MIAEIAELLVRAGLRFTAREIEDIVWLASRIDAPRTSDRAAAPAQAAPLPARTIDNPGEDAGDDASGDDAPAPRSGSRAQDPAEPRLPLHAASIAGNISGSTVLVYGPRQTPAPAALRRALQPFARRMPSRRETRLDEEATVTRIAESGMRLPVFVPVRERRFDLTLVIEDCTSAELRDESLRMLSQDVRYLSGLREVRCYRLLGESPPRLATLDGEAEYGLEHLNSQAADEGRHLVLFATDGTSPRWRSGSAQAFLHAVGARTSVSLLHLLPREAWRRTLIGEPDLTLSCARPGAANTRLHVGLPWWMDADELEGALPVPVLGLDMSSAGAWARAVSALGGASMPGVLVRRPRVPIAPTVPPVSAPSDPAAVVARYRNMASPAAYQLAVYLSRADPVTIPIMRLVQRAMLPDSGDGELAEFLLGGLVTGVEDRGDAAERLYRFRAGIPGELIKALRYSKEEELDRQLLEVGRALESQNSGPHSFKAMFPAPSGALALSRWSLPFAAVSRRILRDMTQSGAAPAGLSAAAVAPGPIAARTRLNVLHLSDMHFGAAGPGRFGRADERFGIPWMAHLRYVTSEVDIDLVCVSGDLTWTASPDQFEQAGRFLDETLAVLRLPKSRLLVVPGNHDMQRDPELARPSDPWLGASDASVTHAGPTGRETEVLARAQSGYRDWLRRYLPQQAAATATPEADFQTALSGWVLPVRVVGIDSTWMNALSTDVALSSAQTQVLEAHPRDGFTIVLMHHPAQHLAAPRDLQRRLQRAGVGLFLHGSRPHVQRTLSSPGAANLVSSGARLSPAGDSPIACHVLGFALDGPDGPVSEEITVHEWLAHRHVWRAMPADHRDGVKMGPSPRAQQATAETDVRDIFVGRAAELNHLNEIFHLHGIRRKRPVRCAITGAAGVGKTALFQHFARAHWPAGGGKHVDYIVTHARDGDQLEESLFETYRVRSVKALAARLRENNTLLVIDDVDSTTLMEQAHRLVKRLPDSPVLLIGRSAVPGGLDWPGWEVLALAPLAVEEATRLLRMLLQITDLTIAAAELAAIVAATDGAPALIRLVAGHLNDTQSAARLIRWLGAGDEVVLSPGQVQDALDDFPWLPRALGTVLAQRWRSRFPDESLDLLAALGHGPVGGFSSSLGLALAGFAHPASNAEAIREFEALCERAVALNFLRREGGRWRFTAPAVLAWLRSHAPAQRELAMGRWTDWLATRLAAPANKGAGPWREVRELPDALREWLATCPRACAEQVRPVCLGYALAHGPLDAWLDFCVRILGSYPDDDPAAADWYDILSQLAHANNEPERARDAVDRFLLLAPTDAGAGNEDRIRAARSLKKRIEDETRSWTKGPVQARRTIPAKAATDRPTAIRPHQQALAQAACKATFDTPPRSAPIGRIVQAHGTGMSATLAAYLDACRNSASSGSERFLVLADRIDIANQLRARLSASLAGFEVTGPATVHELANLLRAASSPIVVTTEQKLRQVEGAFPGDWIVAGFGLGRPSPVLLTPFHAGRLIVFGDESLMYGRSQLDELGPVIASYTREDAIRDGVSGMPLIRQVRIEGISATGSVGGRWRGGFDNEASIRKVAARIGEEWSVAEGSSPRKVVLLVDTAQDAARFAQHLSAEIAPLETSISVLTTGVPFRRKILADFMESTGNALLVTTAALAVGLPLHGLRACYVAAGVVPRAQLKIESFVNRLLPEKAGEIVDFVDNDWWILGALA